ISGPIDPHLFEQALRTVVTEAETLRVAIVERAGVPCQVIAAPLAWPLPFIDISTEADARAAAEAWMKADLARPVDPTRGPLFAFALFKAAPDRFFWYARYHHVVMDGFAMGLVARRVADLYTRLAAGRETNDDAFGSLTALVEQDAAYRASHQFHDDRQFWRDQVAGGPEPVMLGDRVAGASAGLLRATAQLDAAEANNLRALARAAG